MQEWGGKEVAGTNRRFKDLQKNSRFTRPGGGGEENETTSGQDPKAGGQELLLALKNVQNQKSQRQHEVEEGAI